MNARENKLELSSTEAEQAILSVIINSLSNRRWHDVAAKLSLNDFTTKAHQNIFSTVMDLRNQGKQIDPVTVSDACDTSVFTEPPLAYIGEMIKNMTVLESHLDTYIDIVRDRSLRRQSLKYLSQMSQSILEKSTGSVTEIIQTGADQLKQLSKTSINDIANNTDLSELVNEALENYRKTVTEGKNQDLLTSDLDALDEMIGGIEKTDVVIIGGRPGMGKTALMLKIALNVALRGERAVIYNLEMQPVKLATRMMCMLAKVDQREFRDGTLNDQQLERLMEASNIIKTLPIHIDDVHHFTPNILEQRNDYYRETYGDIGLACIDYVQLMKSDNKALHSDKTKDLEEVSRQVKLLAKSNEIPICLLSQLNRDIENRVKKDPTAKPQSSDLKWCGAFEQDASIIIGCHRPEVYFENHPELEGYAEAVVTKSRNGPVGVAKLQWTGKYTLYEDSDPVRLKEQSDYLDGLASKNKPQTFDNR